MTQTPDTPDDLATGDQLDVHAGPSDDPETMSDAEADAERADTEAIVALTEKANS